MEINKMYSPLWHDIIFIINMLCFIFLFYNCFFFLCIYNCIFILFTKDIT